MPLSSTDERFYFESEAGRLTYHPAGYVHMAWAAGRLPVATVQAFYEQALYLLQHSQARRILSEHQQRAPLPPTVQTWLTTDWIPRAIQLTNTRHCAIVEGADPVHRLSTQSIVGTAPAGFQFHRFADRDSAVAWLLSLSLAA